MHEIRVERTLRAPADHVFDVISDHAGYRRFPGITSAELVREGVKERNGLGAVRVIKSGPIRFEEEITAFDRPHRMDYLIRKVNMPIRHDGGSMLMTAHGDETHVLWVSSFETTSRLFAGWFGAASVKALSRGFNRMLSTVEGSYRPQT